MKSLLNQLVWPIFLLLVVGNVYIFISGMKLASEITYFENKSRIFHQENLELEKKVSDLDSYQYAASLAAQFDFAKSKTIYLENLRYALNR